MLSLSTRIHVSCARKLHFSNLSDEENRWLWGSDWSPKGLGGNLVVEASVSRIQLTVSGIKDGAGHLMNPPEFEKLLKRVCGPLDHQELTESILGGLVPSLENIGIWTFKKLQLSLPQDLQVDRVRIQDGKDQWADVFSNEKVRLTKVFHIECVHRHHNPDLSMAENQVLYHKCSAMHGHSYKIEVVVERPLNRGMVMARGELDKIVNEKIVQPLNGTLLNDHLGNTSGEIIAQKFYQILAPHLKGLVTITIRETRKNSFFFVPNSFQSVDIWNQI